MSLCCKSDWALQTALISCLIISFWSLHLSLISSRTSHARSSLFGSHRLLRCSIIFFLNEYMDGQTFFIADHPHPLFTYYIQPNSLEKFSYKKIPFSQPSLLLVTATGPTFGHWSIMEIWWVASGKTFCCLGKRYGATVYHLFCLEHSLSVTWTGGVILWSAGKAW